MGIPPHAVPLVGLAILGFTIAYIAWYQEKLSTAEFSGISAIALLIMLGGFLVGVYTASPPQHYPHRRPLSHGPHHHPL